MAKPEWGTKRVCLSCSARFYDMMRDPIVCPSCETVFDPTANLKTRKTRSSTKVAVEEKKETKKVAEVEDEEDVEAEEEADDDADVDSDSDSDNVDGDDDVPGDDDDDDEEENQSAIEDVSELGDDDVSDVIDTDVESDENAN